MDARPASDRAPILIAAGTTLIVMAVLLFGLETDSGEVDWVNVITAAAGAAVAIAGLILARRDGSSGGSNP